MHQTMSRLSRVWKAVVLFLEVERDFCLFCSIQTGFRAHPASHAMLIGGPSPRLKRQWREAAHSHPSNTEIKNGGALPPFPPYVFKA